MGRTFGAIPSRPDPRDHRVYRYMAVAPEILPPSFKATPLVPVYDQDGYGMCVAFTLAEVKEAEEAVDRGKQVRFSPAFIYGNRGIFDIRGEGMSPRDALKQLRKAGVCPWSMYPILGIYPICRAGITREMRRAALPYVIKAFARAGAVNELKTAIYHTGPCMLCIPVYESFEELGPGGVVPKVKDGERLLGHHAMMVYGWTADGYWKVQNSWGTSWGDGGRCLIPLDYFTLSSNAADDHRMEGWTVVDKLTKI